MSELESLIQQLKSVKLGGSTSHCELDGGTIVGGYEIQRKLGKGRFASVWEAKRGNGSSVALKIYRCREEKYYENEVKILNRVFEHAVREQIPPMHIIGYFGTFAHVVFKSDLSPRVHPVIIFDIAGDSLSKLIRHCRKTYGVGLPMEVVKRITREILIGLKYLHSCGIIHTDIKPENILLNGAASELTPDNIHITIADLGSSCFVDKIFSQNVGTTQYLAPELIIERPYGTPVDIWAAFVTCYELITGDLLFDVYAECETSYGEDVDCEGLEGIVCTEDNCDNNCGDNCGGKSNNSDSNSNDSNSDSNSDSDSDPSEDDLDETKVNYRHLLLIAKVIGYPPGEFTRYARDYYNRRNHLKNNPDINPISISELLISNYEIELPECKKIEDFLLTGLRYMPEHRITAEQALLHPFLI